MSKLSNIFQKINDQNLTLNSGSSNSGYSFGIVNSVDNGKRISFSKRLCEKLGLRETVELAPVLVDGDLIIGTDLQVDKDHKMVLDLKGANKKISYDSAAVITLTDLFKLDYSNKTSMSFSNVVIENENGIVYAVVHIADPLVHSIDPANA